MKKWLMVVLAVVALTEGAAARESCSQPSLKQAFSNSESFFTRDYHSSPYGDYYDGRDKVRASQTQASLSMWEQRTAEYKLSEAPANVEANQSANRNCSYATAIEVLNELDSELGADHPYIKFWLKNQNTLLAGCRTNQRLPLISPAGLPDMPARAEIDFKYQSAASIFYTYAVNELEALQADYVAQAQIPNSPMQDRAAIMALQLAALRSAGDAIEVAKILQKNPASEQAYAHAEDRIFAGLNNYGIGPNNPRGVLEWLVDIERQRNVPKFSANPLTQEAFRKVRTDDASYYLDNYLGPGKLDDDAVVPGWWFLETQLEDSWWRDLRQFSQNNQYIDFRITHAVQTPLTDWKWALYDEGNKIWARSQLIAGHALDRFCAGGGSEWLFEAARLIPPRDPEAPWVRDQLIKALADVDFNKRQPILFINFYQQAVRLSLMIGDDARVVSLMGEQELSVPRDVTSGLDYRVYSQISSYRNMIFQHTQDSVSKWYIHMGRFDKLRAVRGDCNLVFCQALSFKDISEFSESRADVDKLFDLYGEFIFMLDRTSLDALLTLIKKHLSHIDLASLSNIGSRYYTDKYANFAEIVSRFLVRSWLVGREDMIKEAAKLYAIVHPEQKGEAYRFVEADQFGRALFVLRHQSNPYSQPYDYVSVDRKKTGDGLWSVRKWDGLWCQFDPADYDSAMANAWEAQPEGVVEANDTYHYRSYDPHLTYDRTKFAAARREALLNHPLWKAADPAELEALAAIPPGAQYLSSIVISYAMLPKFINQAAGRLDDLPEALHLAVRTARFGCRRNGADYGKVSQMAFKLLHRDYPKSVWSEMTPYWYR